MTNPNAMDNKIKEELFQICDAAEGPTDAVIEIMKKFDLKEKPKDSRTQKQKDCTHPDYAMSKHGSTEMCNNCGQSWG